MEADLLKTIYLVCLSTVDPSACDFDTALWHVRGPDAHIEQCAMSSQTVMAARPDAILGKRYLKVVCERREARR